MSSNPFEHTDSDPHAGLELLDSHQECDLWGRYVERTSTGRKVKYQVSVEREDPLVFFVIDAFAYIVDLTQVPKKEIPERLKTMALEEARRRLDEGDYENDTTYQVRFTA